MHSAAHALFDEGHIKSGVPPWSAPELVHPRAGFSVEFTNGVPERTLANHFAKTVAHAFLRRAGSYRIREYLRRGVAQTLSRQLC